MTKWIFILMMLELIPDTGEFQWFEAIRITNLDYETCVEMVVDTVVTGEDKGIRVDPWCQPQVEKKEDKYTL